MPKGERFVSCRKVLVKEITNSDAFNLMNVLPDVLHHCTQSHRSDDFFKKIQVVNVDLTRSIGS
jgi:hypothetical protein